MATADEVAPRLVGELEKAVQHLAPKYPNVEPAEVLSLAEYNLARQLAKGCEIRTKRYVWVAVENAFRDGLRKCIRNPTVSLDEPVSDQADALTHKDQLVDEAKAPWEAELNQQGMRAHIADALQGLANADYRDALLLFYWARMSYRDIAREMKTTEGNVPTLIRRGKLALQALLEDGKEFSA